MIPFDSLSLEEGGPIYMQIVQYVKQGILAGTIRDQDEMPSRRVLSSLLGVNPNTIQKAYRMLEDEGLIESRAGAMSVVTVDDAAVSRIRTLWLERTCAQLVSALKQSGLTKEEAVRLVDRLWDEEDMPQ